MDPGKLTLASENNFSTGYAAPVLRSPRRPAGRFLINDGETALSLRCDAIVLHQASLPPTADGALFVL